MEFGHFVRVWDSYRHVWEIDREDTIATFVKKKPKLKHFEDELSKYNMAKSQLTTEKIEYRWKIYCIQEYAIGFKTGSFLYTFLKDPVGRTLR